MSTRTRPRVRELLPIGPVLELIEAELASRNLSQNELGRMMSARFGERPDTYRSKLRRAQACGKIDVGIADCYLVALDRLLSELEVEPEVVSLVCQAMTPARPHKRERSRPCGRRISPGDRFCYLHGGAA